MSFSTPTTAAILFTGLYSAYYVAVHPPTIEPQLSFGSLTLFCTIVATIVAAYFALFVIPTFFNTEKFNYIKGTSGRIYRIANSPRGFMGHAHPIIDRSSYKTGPKRIPIGQGSDYEILFSCGEDRKHRHPDLTDSDTIPLYYILTKDVKEAIVKLGKQAKMKSKTEIEEQTDDDSRKQFKLISTEKLDIPIYLAQWNSEEGKTFFKGTNLPELTRSSYHEHYLTVEIFTTDSNDITEFTKGLTGQGL